MHRDRKPVANNLCSCNGVEGWCSPTIIPGFDKRDPFLFLIAEMETFASLMSLDQFLSNLNTRVTQL